MDKAGMPKAEGTHGGRLRRFEREEEEGKEERSPRRAASHRFVRDIYMVLAFVLRGFMLVKCWAALAASCTLVPLLLRHSHVRQ